MNEQNQRDSIMSMARGAFEERVDYEMDKVIQNIVSTNDNGVTQTVEARQGVALNALIEIKPRVMLRPFRTFLEVEQPESEFLLRVDPDEGIGFFEADGGIWKLEAKKNIADYFLKNMGDLIDAGKVVVMQ